MTLEVFAGAATWTRTGETLNVPAIVDELSRRNAANTNRLHPPHDCILILNIDLNHVVIKAGRRRSLRRHAAIDGI